MPLDPQRPAFELAVMDALAGDGGVILRNRLAHLDHVRLQVGELTTMVVQDGSDFTHSALQPVETLAVRTDCLSDLHQEPIDRAEINAVTALRHSLAPVLSS
jgi:hypothetical protein